MKLCDQQRYKENKPQILRRKRKERLARLAVNKAFVKAYLLEHSCIDCQEADIVVLDFDHVRGRKKHNVADMLNNNSLVSLKKEIAKCEVRCANCHRRKHRRSRT